MMRANISCLGAMGLCLLAAATLQAQPAEPQPDAEPAPESAATVTPASEPEAEPPPTPGPGSAAGIGPQPTEALEADQPPAPAQDAAPAPDAPARAPQEQALPAGGGPVIELDEADTTISPGAASTEAAAPEERQSEGTLVERTASAETGVTLGGYGQHEFVVPDDEDPFFRNHRYVVFVYARISERISSATEIEFEFAGSPLKKDGTLGPGEVLLEFSVIDFELAEWLVLRAGVILVPVGSFNINHDAPGRELVDRPIAYTTVVPTTWFESGAGLHGKIGLGEQRLSYELYAVNGLDARIFDGFGLRAARGSHFEDNNADKAVVGRLAWSPVMNLDLGLSGYSGEYDKLDNRVNIGALDVSLRAGDLQLLAEAVYVSIDPGYVQGFSASSEANTRDPVPTGMWGYYLQANYHFRIEPLWKLFPADMQQGTLTAALRYEGKDTDVDRRSSAGDQRRLTLGFNFRPVQQLVFKSDFQWNSRGQDLGAKAPELWQSGFWKDRDAGFLFDSYVASVAYLF